MMDELGGEKAVLLEYSKKMQEIGLVVGPGGNTSIIDKRGIMWISPSGIPFLEMKPEDFIPVDVASGMIVRPGMKLQNEPLFKAIIKSLKETSNQRSLPSSEVPLHLKLYRARPEISCIFHSHPPTVIALSTLGKTVEPLFPDFIVYLGDRVPLADYTTPCTEEMADAVVSVMKDVPACIIRNHGAVTVGRSIKEAYTRAEVLESSAQIYYKALLLGEPRVLTRDECDAIKNLDIEKYRQKLLEGGI
ncbi:MAG: class II aldolase/adducin family protein [Promethearchaeota archaeon]